MRTGCAFSGGTTTLSDEDFDATGFASGDELAAGVGAGVDALTGVADGVETVGCAFAAEVTNSDATIAKTIRANRPIDFAGVRG
jgi:hypothetical protein